MTDMPNGYKQSEVGVIPEEWEVTRLGQLTEKVGSGLTPTGGSRVYKDSGRPFIRSQNVGWGQLDLDDVAYIDDATHESFDATEIRAGDVFLNITGASIGRSAMADQRIVGGNVNQHVCIIRVDHTKLVPDFLCAFLISSHGQQQIDSFQAGGNRQGLNFGQVRSISIMIPPTISEQRAIAAALSDVDALLAGLDRLIAKKRDLKQAAMQQLLTGQTRLPGFQGEWEKVKFSDLTSPGHGRIDPSHCDPHEFCVELEHIDHGTGRLLGWSTTTPQSSLKATFETGDVLFGKLRAYLRKYWLATREGVCSTEIWVFKPNPEFVISGYLYQIVTMDRFIDAASTAYGTHMPRSDWKVVREQEQMVPPLPEQTAIASVLSDMDAEIDSLERRRAKTADMKQAMMQELLTGRTRLV